MNPTTEKIDSGEEVKETSTDMLNSSHMDKVKSIVNDKKTLYRHSAKLKSHIHSQIQDLIETLKERERQLFLEIDEHELDCSISIADYFSDILLPSSDDKDSKMCSASLQKKLLKFVGDPEQLKAELQQFGKLEESGETANESPECSQKNSPKAKKFQLAINGLMRKLSRRNGTKRMHSESSGSVESFEVIDGLDDEEYQKYFSSFKNEDDIEDVSNSEEFRPWRPSFPVSGTGFWNDTEPNGLNPPTHVQEASEKVQQSAQSPYALEVTDPVAKINKQLQSLLQPKTDSKAQTSQLDVPARLSAAFPLVQEAKSNVLSSQPPKTTHVPSAIVKLSLNKYLNQEDTRNWLVSSDGGLNGKTCGVDSLVSNFKGLHFKMC